MPWRFEVTVLLALGLVTSALGQGLVYGPVGQQCARDIARYCSHLTHGNAEVRNCLVMNRPYLSRVCRQALDSTGAGRRPGLQRR